MSVSNPQLWNFARGAGGGGLSTYDLTGTYHFAQKVDTRNSLNSDEF